jgi:DNA-directed RNA polymerase specialized sigma24 family protein
VEPEDLSILAMMVDGTPIAEVADTLRRPVREVSRRLDAMIERLRVEIATV